MLALLGPTRLCRLAGGFGSLCFAHVCGAGFPAFAASKLAQDSGCLSLLLFSGHGVILAWAGRHGKDNRTDLAFVSAYLFGDAVLVVSAQPSVSRP